MIPEIFFISIATLFVVVGPLDVSFIYASLTANYTTKQRIFIAWKGVIIATVLLLTFALIGDQILHFFGITLSSMKIAGGIMLLLLGLRMVTEQPEDINKSKDIRQEASNKGDIFVFPLATPLLAGPGSMGTAVLLASSAGDDWYQLGWVIASIVLVMTFALLMLIAASSVHKFVGRTGSQIIMRIFGVLVSAIAIEFFVNGIKEAQIFS